MRDFRNVQEQYYSLNRFSQQLYWRNNISWPVRALIPHRARLCCLLLCGAEHRAGTLLKRAPEQTVETQALTKTAEICFADRIAALTRRRRARWNRGVRVSAEARLTSNFIWAPMRFSDTHFKWCFWKSMLIYLSFGHLRWPILLAGAGVPTESSDFQHHHFFLLAFWSTNSLTQYRGVGISASEKKITQTVLIMPMWLTVWISHFERLIICKLNDMKVPADIRLHTYYTDWPDGGAVMKGQKTGCCATCWILMKLGEMMHLKTDWSEVFVSSFGTETVSGGVYLSKYSYSWVHYQITEISGRKNTRVLFEHEASAHVFFFVFFCLLLNMRWGVSVEGLSADECVMCSLSLSLMLKWLEKESEVLCEAVIRAELQRLWSVAASLAALCTFLFVALTTWNETRWEQRWTGIKTRGEKLPFRAKAANGRVLAVRRISGARVRL